MLEIIPVEYWTNIPSMDYMVAMRKFKYAKRLGKEVSRNRKRYVRKGSLLVMVIPCDLYVDEYGYFYLVDDLLKWDGYDVIKDRLEYEDMSIRIGKVKRVVNGE